MTQSASPAYDPARTTALYERAVSRRVRTAETWSAARQLYAQGATGPEVMERYGIGRSAFYERARREGWLRKDQLADEPLTDDYDDNPAQLERTAAELAVDAWSQVCRAVDRGRLAEARGWSAVYRDLHAAAVRQAEKGTFVLVDPGGDGRPRIYRVEPTPPAEPGSPDSRSPSQSAERTLRT